ncbi:glyoxalase superfamily protein [Mesorhizobium sp. 1B3]|uniref:glyoxalase superfamily protein n=1 Tax=Mesorhizobium sp. 1B3 TaxID=3243599 RepID=UPI003D990898
MGTLARSKSMAKALRKALDEQQIELSHSACLEIVARQLGFSDWNVLKAACDEEMSLTLTIFVEHGRQQEAALFFEAALGAVQTQAHHLRDGELMALDMRIGDRTISICGSNPHREAEPSRGGPFFLKEKGSGSTIFRLDVRDAAVVLKRAVAAGATIRNAPELADNGHRVAAFFDPFGHIWGLHEKSAAMNRQAA